MRNALEIIQKNFILSRDFFCLMYVSFFIMGYILIFFENSPLLSLEEITGIFLVSGLILFLFYLSLKKYNIPQKILYSVLAFLGILYVYIYWKDMYYIFPDRSRYFRYNKMILLIVYALGPIFFTYLVTKKETSND